MNFLPAVEALSSSPPDPAYEESFLRKPFPNIIKTLLLVALLLVAGFLRLHNIGDNPGWNSDERTHLEIAPHLMQGRVQPNEIVVASPAVGWLLCGAVSDFQFSAVAMCANTPHLLRERFASEHGLENAQYVVPDNLWRNRGVVHIPVVARMLTEIDTEWKLLHESGAVRNYRGDG